MSRRLCGAQLGTPQKCVIEWVLLGCVLGIFTTENTKSTKFGVLFIRTLRVLRTFVVNEIKVLARRCTQKSRKSLEIGWSANPQCRFFRRVQDCPRGVNAGEMRAIVGGGVKICERFDTIGNDLGRGFD